MNDWNCVTEFLFKDTVEIFWRPHTNQTISIGLFWWRERRRRWWWWTRSRSMRRILQREQEQHQEQEASYLFVSLAKTPTSLLPSHCARTAWNIQKIIMLIIMKFNSWSFKTKKIVCNSPFWIWIVKFFGWGETRDGQRETERETEIEKEFGGFGGRRAVCMCVCF